MIHRIEVYSKKGFGDPHAAGIHAEIGELGLLDVTAVRSARLFFLAGALSADDAHRVAEQLLTDPVVEEWVLCDGPGAPATARSANGGSGCDDSQKMRPQYAVVSRK